MVGNLSGLKFSMVQVRERMVDEDQVDIIQV